ncbi:MAG: YkgJ family cysteine cluster protein [Candidatus Kapabacteria bacterium]|nr:YkgJ family cysteine cluster protein [Candidatus Kapabacteria bacterium]
MICRQACGACCIAPSITSPIPGMPNGKPAGVRCVQLTDDMKCQLFGSPLRPVFCGTLQPNEQMCGSSRDQAMDILTHLEIETRPERPNA